MTRRAWRCAADVDPTGIAFKLDGRGRPVPKALHELPFDDIEGKLRSMSEVRAVPTRPPGTYLMSQNAEHADIVLGMLPDEALDLPICAGYVFLERPRYVALHLQGTGVEEREVSYRKTKTRRKPSVRLCGL